VIAAEQQLGAEAGVVFAQVLVAIEVVRIDARIEPYLPRPPGRVAVRVRARTKRGGAGER
jgi:hypothetical protein